jgi:hypothetical protein
VARCVEVTKILRIVEKRHVGANIVQGRAAERVAARDAATPAARMAALRTGDARDTPADH